MRKVPERVISRLMQKTHRDSKGCLVSDYSAGGNGYAQIGWVDETGRYMVLAHRAAWEHYYGPIPDGMTVDHTCPHGRNTKCIERTHLRLLTNFENARRTDGRDWPLGQCANGHDNRFLKQIRSNGKLGCSICKADWARRYREKMRNKC